MADDNVFPLSREQQIELMKNFAERHENLMERFKSPDMFEELYMQHVTLGEPSHRSKGKIND